MKKILLSLVFLCPLVGYAVEEDSLQSYMLADLDTVHNHFSFAYAPARMKQESFEWNLKSSYAQAKEAILLNENMEERAFRQLIKQYCYRTMDYHVELSFYSTEKSTLPFSVAGAEGRYFVTFVNTTKNSSPIEVGDELISFDGRPIDTVVQELVQTQERQASLLTDQRLAERSLTKRFGAYMDDCPEGKVAVTIKKKKDGSQKNLTFNWSHTPEEVFTSPSHLRTILRCDSLFSHVKSTPARPTKKKENVKELLLKRNFWGISRSSLDEQTADNPFALRSKEGFLPLLGDPIWKNDPENNFHSYIFKTKEGVRVGFIRIPTYLGDEGELEGCAAEFALTMYYFEKATDMLIIDQTNNGGGYLFYMYALLTHLSDNPLTPQLEQIKLTHQEYYEQLDIQESLASLETEEELKEAFGDGIMGYPITLEGIGFLKEHAKALCQGWKEGKSLSDFLPVEGIPAIIPHPSHRYTKPILLLINELDFSCADFFPAVLQDNGRAILMGSPTVGAGGAVKRITPPSYFGIEQLSYTFTLAMRSNGEYLENAGVTPDVPYTITADDLTNNFEGYRQAILDQIRVMLK